MSNTRKLITFKVVTVEHTEITWQNRDCEQPSSHGSSLIKAKPGLKGNGVFNSFIERNNLTKGDLIPRPSERRQKLRLSWFVISPILFFLLIFDLNKFLSWGYFSFEGYIVNYKKRLILYHDARNLTFKNCTCLKIIITIFCSFDSNVQLSC